MADTLITPPIRSALIENNDPSVRTASRDWWLYWNSITDQTNSNALLVSQGRHADRLDATNVPDGALYGEFDRGVIYQAQNGHWQYMAGTMYGTLNPDERPTDLGVHDPGFQFRSIDADPAYGGRQFLWTQSAWVEVTAANTGTHTDRPAATSMVDGAIYTENDRYGVIYQNWNGTWKYLAGTMYGTLTPDQRPTDLGVNDAGFSFRSTDQQRTFVWSGTTWVETTPLLFGSHAARLAITLTTLSNGTLWTETDRNEVLYQNQSGVWHYIGGTMFGTLSPDQRPTDLASGDTGFLFQTTDTYQLFRWNGSSWIEATQANSVQLAYNTASLTLTTSSTAIPGAQLTLSRAGRYLIIGVFDFASLGAGDLNQTFIGQLNADGVLQGQIAVFTGGSTNDRGTICQQWLYTPAVAGKVVGLAAYKTGGTGTSVAYNGSISASWIGR